MLKQDSQIDYFLRTEKNVWTKIELYCKYLIERTSRVGIYAMILGKLSWRRKRNKSPLTLRNEKHASLLNTLPSWWAMIYLLTK